MTYTPRGFAAKLIENLQIRPDGYELSFAEAAEVMGCPVSSVSANLAAAFRHGALTREKRGIASFVRLGDGALQGDEEPGDFAAGLWSDGELVIRGAQLNEDGSFTLSADQVAEVRKLLAGGVAP